MRKTRMLLLILVGVFIVFISYGIRQFDRNEVGTQTATQACMDSDTIREGDIHLGLMNFSYKKIGAKKIYLLRHGKKIDSINFNNLIPSKDNIYTVIVPFPILKTDSLMLDMDKPPVFYVHGFENYFEEHYSAFGKVGGGECRFRGAIVNDHGFEKTIIIDGNR